MNEGNVFVLPFSHFFCFWPASHTRCNVGADLLQEKIINDQQLKSKKILLREGPSLREDISKKGNSPYNWPILTQKLWYLFVFGNFYINMIIMFISAPKKMLVFNFWYSFDNKGRKLPFWSFHWEIRIGRGSCRQRRHQRCGRAWRRPSCSPLRRTSPLSRRPSWTSWNGTSLGSSREVYVFENNLNLS